jgi:transcriptional regulator with AAA-type ATPase domain/tetratricopeptide (TPR) repeat protein
VGLVALFRAAWERAHDALREARRLLVLQPAPDDPEEIARLEHNLGVVASYRGQAAEAIGAFERSLAAKQRLGDRAGVRASLRNLGYALTQAGRFDEAARALDEALALARSLGQAAGRAWCLSARAEVEARRGAPREAERFIAEAEALGDALPAAVRVDLCLLRAEVLAMEGDGPTALTQLRSLDPAERSEDALADARALVIEARAHLACLPAAPRRAARAAIAAIRRARAGGLPEPEAQGIAALRQARSPRDAGLPARADQAHDAPMDSEHSAALWAWLERVGEGQPIEACAIDLALLILGQSGAERAFVALVSPAADILSAWAVDLDGLALGDAVRRVPMDALRASLTHPAPIYQRAVPTVGGQGARLAVASAEGPAGRVVLLIEHRLVPGRFDRLDEARVLRWRSLAAVLGRLAADARPAPLPAASRPASAPSAPTPAASAPPPAPSTPPRSEPEPPPRRRSPPPEVTTIQPEGELRRQFPAILGSSEPLRRALARLDLAIDSELPVLIVGETGVGKELFARAVHEQGARSQAPFVAVNCAAIPDSLFEAELFGHARGSFTGADRARPGLIARAEGGTLFLDEIGELKPARQASLLRVLESRLYRPVGSDEERPARVRVVAATNVELERAVEAGAFRQDLLFRLNVLRIRVPPLRERPEDVAFLAHHFLERAGAAPAFSPAALSALQAHGWPGNVRELEHQMQRLAVLRLPRIELAHLPREIRATAPVSAPAPRSAPDERDEVTRALDACGGNISHAAKQLGLTRHGLKKRMLRLGLRERAEAKSTP